MAYFWKHSLMLPKQIRQGEFCVPTRLTLNYYACLRRAEVKRDDDNPLRGGCGAIMFFHIKGTKYRFATKDAVEAMGNRSMQNEMCCNYILIHHIQDVLKNKTTADIFLKIGAAYITKYIACIEVASSTTNNEQSEQKSPHPGPTYQLIFEKAPGYSLLDDAFLQLPQPSDTERSNITHFRHKFLSENLRIIGQIGLALELVHNSGIAHRDIKLSNIMYDPVGRNIKLIDFGLSQPFDEAATVKWPLILASYCSSLEEYRLLKRYMGNKCAELKLDLLHLNSPLTDIYGVGIMSIGIFFRSVGRQYLSKNFEKIPHDDCESNIKNRKYLYDNLTTIIHSLNDELPIYLRYSNEELNFIENIIKCCLNPIPSERPSAAQICGLCELFNAGITNFAEALCFIRELRPSREPPTWTQATHTKYNDVILEK